MIIQINKIGVLRQATFELGELTILCGRNNTGKTYATYALFGFLSFWREAYSIKVSEEWVQLLLEEGAIQIRLEDYVANAQQIVNQACTAYTEQLPSVFASSEKHFTESSFTVDFDASEVRPLESFSRTMGAATTQLFNISKEEGSPLVSISLLVERDKVKIPRDVINRIIGDALKEIVFGRLFPHPFIASAERTGAAIFRKELNFARNRLLEQMSLEKDLNPFELLSKVYSDYALPVRTNVDFTRQLEGLAQKRSFLEVNHPALLEAFADIIGGEYLVTSKDELYFVPRGKRIRLTMDESSSAVRSLLDLGFYLRHAARPGDLLMVDEPELNLHPVNQRRIARLFSRLIKLGIRVFITTHSDYIIKELNTLIMLNQDSPRLQALAESEGYASEELLSAKSVRVYMAEEALFKPDGGQRKVRCPTLISADIDPYLGIEAKTFDETIDQMNRIQEAILFDPEGD